LPVSFGAHDDVKEQIRRSLDLTDVIGGYLELRREGRHLVALCPWHDDSRPSLQVNPERQSWKCWVCDVGGDLFSFVMRKEGVGFREALELLADRAGVSLPRGGRGGGAGTGGGEKRALYQVLAWAEEQFHLALQNSADAQDVRRYVEQRGIDAGSISRHRLGFAPSRSRWLLDRAQGTSFEPSLLEAAGLIARSPSTGQWYDRFRGRWIFPIRDAQGRVIAFGGRAIPGLTPADSAKYINSPETRLFSKSEHLYGLDLARDHIAKTRRITIMEGYTDVIMAWQQGLTDVVAVLGTALGRRHLPLLRRFADTITLVLDGDAAGQRRTNEILELFVAEKLDLRILTLPEGLDPCDYLQQQGAAAFQAAAGQAVDALEHKIRLATQGLRTVDDTAAANQALEEILRVMGLAAPPEQLGAARLREQQILARLARQFHVSDQHLSERLAEIRSRRSSAAAPRPGPLPPANPASGEAPRYSLRHLPARDRELLEILSLEPDLWGAASRAIAPTALLSEPARQVYALYAQLTARLGVLDFSRLLSEVEQPHLQSLLVDIDEEAQRKAERILQSPAERLEELIESYRRLQRDQDGHRRVDELHRIRDEQQELDSLQEIIELTRQRQGLTAPMDG
jgi:DNA primase